MLELLKALPEERYAPRTYVCAETDVTSERRATSTGVVPASSVPFLRIPRSREVGQSYVTSLFTTLWAMWACFLLVLRARPDLVLVNGPGTCLPVCLAARLLRLIGLLPRTSRTVFVESVCRVKTLSLTGKLLYRFRLADQVQVQWPQLREAYPRAELVGVLL
jgi:beta-1,4-N-acetylglucosaminyltransferase